MYAFGDGFDCYAASSDALLGYWDSGTVSALNLTAGRFAGGQAVIQASASANVIYLTKSSGANDATHHISVAYRYTGTLAGSNLNACFQLLDGTTGQCAIVFCQDGRIILNSGSGAGATLATYAGAVTAVNTWYQFEIEVVIHPSAGSFKVRRNGSTTDDHSTTGINTRPGTNSYANKLQVSAVQGSQQAQLDDLLWRSDASSVQWVGDIRCITRMPVSDVSVQFSRAPNPYVQTVFSTAVTSAVNAGTARYGSFTAAYDGTIASATVSFGTGYTGNLKCSLFASSGTGPTAVLGSANILANPVPGFNALTFGTPVVVVKGTQYWIGFDSDTSSGNWHMAGTQGVTSTTAYASFPVASPGITSGMAVVTSTVTITPTTNYQMVNETLQDGTTSYVYDSTPGHSDLYTIASIASTPTSTVAVTARAFMQKSDAGTRGAAVQLKSGATTVASSGTTLSSSSWGWAWRTELTDPANGSAWTAAAVNNVQVGPVVTV